MPVTEPTKEAAGPPGGGLAARLRWAGLAGLLASAAVYVGHIFLGSNLHEVVPGVVYRCSQPSPRELDRIVREHGIKTVVNLRGSCPDQDWFQKECATCNRLGVSQESLGFSAGHFPSVTEVRRLVEVIDRSEPPLLFHCFRGVDRTGMAAMMALLLKTDRTVEEAHRELGLRYLHLPFGRTGFLDKFMASYSRWLEGRGEEHSPALFRRWVMHEYRGGKCAARVELLALVLPDGRELPVMAARHSDDPVPNAAVRIRWPSDLPVGVKARFHNVADEAWDFHPHDNAGVHACFLLQEENGNNVRMGRAGRFHATVPPGESIDLMLTVPPVRRSGRLVLKLDMIEEQHCYFHEVGMDPLTLVLELP